MRGRRVSVFDEIKRKKAEHEAAVKVTLATARELLGKEVRLKVNELGWWVVKQHWGTRTKTFRGRSADEVLAAVREHLAGKQGKPLELRGGVTQ
jgi:hypothetical protein